MKKKHQKKGESFRGSKTPLDKAQDKRIHRWIPALSVALITFLVYLPALQNGFVNWDDQLYVYENQNIRAINLKFLKWSASAEANPTWHPMTLFSIALDYRTWDINPFGYHLTNNLIHSLNTFLVFILVLRLIERSTLWKDSKEALIVASVTSLLFGIHPLHVESVAWVSERKDVLSAFFFLLTLLAYFKYVSVQHSKWKFYVLSLVSFILALMSKPMVVTLPAVLLILDYYPFKRLSIEDSIKNKSIIYEKLPFFILAFIAAFITIWTQFASGTLQTLEKFPLTVRTLSAIHAYIFYLLKMVIPINLAPLYPYSNDVRLFSFEYSGSLILLAIITISAIQLLKGSNVFTAIWFYYLITLIPVSGIFQFAKHAAANRYTYLPSLGPFLLAGLGLGHLFYRYPRYRVGILTIAVLLSGIMANETIKQIGIWRDSITLWSYEIKLYPDASPVPYNNRGNAFNTKGNYLEAIEDFSKAIELDPKYAVAYLNRGSLLNSIGKYEEATKDFTKAIELDFKLAHAYNGRGNAFYSIGDREQAIKDLSKAIELDPKLRNAYFNLGIVYHDLGNYQLAINAYNRAIELNPQSADAYSNRGSALSNIGNKTEAIKDFSRAVELNSQFADAYFNRGAVYKDIGNYQEAIIDLGKAISLNPQDAMAYYNLGSIYEQSGDIERANFYHKKAASLGLKEAQILLKGRRVAW